MQLKLKTDYGLRVLLYLARRADLEGDWTAVEPVSAETVASAFDISREHLVKVVQNLTRLGYVSTRAGRGGGLLLAEDPEVIDVGEVIERLEGREGGLDCVATPKVCVLEPGCRLRRKLMEAEAAFFDALRGTTVAELASVRGRRGGLLNLDLR